MTDVDATAGLIENASETLDQQIVGLFEVLGNEIRLATLLALWEARDPGPGTPGIYASRGLTFSELRTGLGSPDSGQFNYHLDQLTDEFVTEREDGYILTASAERVLSAVFAGSLSDHASFEGEPIDTVCQQCGEESVVIDYTETRLIKRCTNCEGQYDLRDQPTGLLAYFFRPPAGLAHQSPQEFFRTTNIWYWNRIRTIHQGVCPDCSGTISTTIAVCEEHQTADGSLCENCGSAFEVQPYYVCEICELISSGGWHTPPLTDSAVMAFFYDHDLDPEDLYAEGDTHVLHNAVDDVALESEAPKKVRVTYVIDGDRLQVTLDDETTVIDVSEGPIES